MSLRSPPFTRLVNGLKHLGKRCTVIESCCGGLISTSLMAEPGSSAVYYGGSIAYNTGKSKKLLLNDDVLHSKLLEPVVSKNGETPGDVYIRSKVRWTAKTALAFCEQMDVDFAVAEGGASGPTFRPEGLDEGFAVIAVAGRDDSSGKVKILAQEVVHSTHSDREGNMRLFADAAANITADAIGIPPLTTTTATTTTEDKEEEFPAFWLDRATSLRVDPEAMKRMEEHPDAKHVVMRGREALFASTTELDLASEVNSRYKKTFLGLATADNTPIFCIDADESFKTTTTSYFADTRSNAPLLLTHHNELALYATAMTTWQRNTKFCTKCGSPQTLIDGGTCLQCNSCQTKSWPRQDPSIIVLITNPSGSKALLAHSSRHPTKMHTTLAGFVEAGETYEKAVIRESFEETGVTVDPSSITYLGSQPWPFPQSTMIAFRATADDQTPLHVDTNEILDAKWFHVKDVAAAAKVPGALMLNEVAERALLEDPHLELLIPPKGVIARTLIDHWLADSII